MVLEISNFMNRLIRRYHILTPNFAKFILKLLIKSALLYPIFPWRSPRTRIKLIGCLIAARFYMGVKHSCNTIRENIAAKMFADGKP